MLDFNKDVMSYLEGAEADYLILDLGTLFAKAVLKIRSRQSPEHYTYITNAQAIKENPGFLENPFFEVVDTMYFSDYYEMMMSYIPRYTELLKSHYPTEKMIIIEVPVTERYIDADGTLKSFKTGAYALEDKVEQAYRLFEELLPGAHVIKQLGTEIFCNKRHKWGLHRMHYVIEYYQYLLDAVRTVCCDLNRSDEDFLLQRLNDTYTRLLRSAYAEFSLSGRYTLKNLSVVSSTAVRTGSRLFVALDASGGTGVYRYEVYVRPPHKTRWQPVAADDAGIAAYVPNRPGTYEFCVKVRDENNCVDKKYFNVTVS